MGQNAKAWGLWRFVMAEKKFYVYVLARTDGTPFYVGKGTGRRVYQHAQEARAGHKCHKCNVIRKIWRQGGEVQKYMMLETDSEQEAFNYECELIAMYGRENLANLTDGGEGACNPSQETIDKRRLSRAGYRHSPETRAKISAGNTGKKLLPEQRAAISVRSRGRQKSKETLRKLSESLKGKVKTLEVRLKIGASNTIAHARPGAKQKTREAARQRWSDDKYRALIKEKLDSRRSDPEYREKMSQAQVASYQANPGRQEKIRVSTTERWTDPDFRARQSAGLKAAWARRKAAQGAQSDES